MITTSKSFLSALQDTPLLGLNVMYPVPGIIERIGADWDWIWIDGQHGELDYADILAAVRACNLIGRYALVRVPSHEAGWIGRALDTAADAVMVPMVDTVEQAKAVVQAAKFPPAGSRSYGGRRPIDLFGRNYSHADRPQPLLVCQIETHLGLKNAEAIAAIDGVDALFFGPDDMALREGLAMDQPRPEGHFDAALDAMAQAAVQQGKIAAGVFTTPADLTKALRWGYRMLVGAGDMALASNGSQNALRSLRPCLGTVPKAVGEKASPFSKVIY